MTRKATLCKRKRWQTSGKRVEVSRSSCDHPRKPFAPSRKLWRQLDEYQRDAVKFALSQKGCGLFFEQGTGKTWISGGIIESLLSPTFECLLVVPLTNIETTWVKTLRSQLPQLHIARTLEDFLQAPFPRCLLLHYEAVPKVIQKLRKRVWDAIIYDECHRLKARGTLQSRTAAKLRDCARYKIGLSGTPIEKQPQDLWGQFRFFAPHVFGTRWKDFEAEYFEPVVFNPQGYRPGSMRYLRELRRYQIAKHRRPFDEKKLPQFLKRIEGYALRVTKDVLGLPPLTYIEEEVTLRGFQRTLYQELERDMVSSVLNVSAPLKITQIGKLQQITGGYLFDDDGNVLEVGRAKLRRVKRILRQNETPVVIFCKYRQEVRCISEELMAMGYSVGTLTGSTPKRERPSIIERFQAGKTDVLVCQTRTGGVGIDLFRSHRIIVYSTTHSYIDFDQLISRVHRRGQQKEVSVHLLIARGTIDMAIFRALIRKRNASRSVLNHLRRKTNGERKEDGIKGGGARVQVHGRELGCGPRHTATVRSDRAAQARGSEGWKAVWLEQPKGLSSRPEEAARRKVA